MPLVTQQRLHAVWSPGCTMCCQLSCSCGKATEGLVRLPGEECTFSVISLACSFGLSLQKRPGEGRRDPCFISNFFFLIFFKTEELPDPRLRGAERRKTLGMWSVCMGACVYVCVGVCELVCVCVYVYVCLSVSVCCVDWSRKLGTEAQCHGRPCNPFSFSPTPSACFTVG